MKTLRVKTISLFLAMGMLWITVNASSQDVKLTRQERKEVRKAQLEVNFSVLDSLLNAKSFVLVADFLQNGYGERVPVVPNLNFIKVNRLNGILQTGSNSAQGYNGVGGVTAEGNLGTWSISKDYKSLSYTVHFSISTNIGYYDIFLNVNSENNATATITGLGPGRLTWIGHLETVNNSRVFKGYNSI
jgi:hypothetical protein